MHKFVHDTKSVMGLSPKTEDLEYNENSKAIRKVESAIREYKASIHNMKRAAEAAFDSLQEVAKAFGAIANQCRSVCIADMSTYCSNSVKQMNNDLTAFKVSLEGETVIHMTELMVLVDECKKLDTARAKVMHEYDTYRDSVTQKEAEYIRRGKDLATSKHYQGDVAKRDELKKQYEEANASYNCKVNKVQTEKLRAFENSMKTFSSSTAKFLGCLSGCMSEVSSRA